MTSLSRSAPEAAGASLKRKKNHTWEPCRLFPMESVNGLMGIKSAATPIYGGTKAGIPFHTGISDTRWMSNLTAILYLSIITEQR